MRILLVEDDLLIAMGLRLVLEGHGHTVVGHSTTTDKAIRLAAEHRPDLAIVDVNLAGGDSGIDAARGIRAFGVPAIYLTANVEQVEAVWFDAIARIEKPVGPKVLISVLDEVEAMLKVTPAGRPLAVGRHGEGCPCGASAAAQAARLCRSSTAA